MFEWVFGWWGGSNGDEQQQQNFVEFDEQAYKRYAVDRRAHSDLVRWDVFRCHPFTFRFRYVVDDNNGRCCNVVDFCKGLEINHDLLLSCNLNRQHVFQLNQIVLGAPPTDFNADSLGSLFATKHGLIQLLQQLPFINKNDVLMAIETDKCYDHDDVRDKIETVLKHIKALNANSDKFISAHKSFKLEVNARFKQMEQRFENLDNRLNSIPHERTTSSIAIPGVVFPRDVTKHEHLAVFMNRVDDGTQIAFARGQQEHFRKRKLKFEDTMDIMFEGVHPNPVMAVNRIKEELYGSGHKMKKLRNCVLEVKCTVDTAKDIVKKAIL
uniref:DUF3627 domain-containing protein n=1 Tax=Anticarsia gemmatalis multiple nucleopolyhedrovirus TaxID=268591 RepID=A0A0S3IYX8_9ABAC|nr:hypothetical protein AGNV_147 [Anticarsia gemmatalis multiple nucleopolyhedrovirus]